MSSETTNRVEGKHTQTLKIITYMRFVTAGMAGYSCEIEGNGEVDQ